MKGSDWNNCIILDCSNKVYIIGETLNEISMDYEGNSMLIINKHIRGKLKFH